MPGPIYKRTLKQTCHGPLTHDAALLMRTIIAELHAGVATKLAAWMIEHEGEDFSSLEAEITITSTTKSDEVVA